jgi:hypothetical protein
MGGWKEVRKESRKAARKEGSENRQNTKHMKEIRKDGIRIQ